MTIESELPGGPLKRMLTQLRRHARMLTGSQVAGDAGVRSALETLMAAGSLPGESSALRRALFTAFHDTPEAALAALPGTGQGTSPRITGGAAKVAGHVRALPETERAVLLLTTLSEFPLEDAAGILGLSLADAEAALSRARAGLEGQTATRVLIIEDEPIIALDLSRIVSGMGHTITGIADTATTAVSEARRRRPGVILCDIQLRDGSSGLDAAHEILDEIDVPVIFVTAFPERLLTGERVEPVWLVTKPFDPVALRVTISQALLMHPAAAQPVAG